MSYLEIKPYFRARLATVGGLREWKDGFNFENIPSTFIDGAFHIELGAFTNIKQNQECLDTSGPVTIRFFVKGFQDVQAGIDKALAKGEAILKESLKAANRATQPGIKNIKLGSFAVDPIQISNDNIVQATLQFDLTLLIEI